MLNALYRGSHGHALHRHLHRYQRQSGALRSGITRTTRTSCKTDAKDQQLRAGSARAPTPSPITEGHSGRALLEDRVLLQHADRRPAAVRPARPAAAAATRTPSPRRRAWRSRCDPERTCIYFTYAKGFRPGGANNPCRGGLRPGLRRTSASAGAADLQLRHRRQLRNRRQEQHRQPREDSRRSIYYIRWNNIQQTVRPADLPGVISFIDNLGQAVGLKGRGRSGGNRRRPTTSPSNSPPATPIARYTAGFEPSALPSRSRRGGHGDCDHSGSQRDRRRAAPGTGDRDRGARVSSSTAFARESFIRVDAE